MGLLEEALEEHDAKSKGGRSCQMCQILNGAQGTLSPEDRDELAVILADKRFSGTTISSVLRARGIEIRFRNVQNHRASHTEGWNE